jgi:hypothetical protein
MQLGWSVEPNRMFRNYLYVSGTTATLREYFRWFADMALERAPWAESVLEVACNDGSQLDAFRELGMETYGVDPAENLHMVSSKRHRVACGYMNRDTARTLGREKYDLLVAQNVVAHTPSPLEMLVAIKELMHERSLLFIQTSQADMVKMGQFDTVYHEHISFFCMNSMNQLLRRAGLKMVDAMRVAVHGGSIVFVASTGGEMSPDAYDDGEEFDARCREGLERFAESAKGTMDAVRDEVELWRGEGWTVAGYGAAAKGNTVLNGGSISLDFIVDDNPMKQGLFTPGMRIPILSPEEGARRAVGRIRWVLLSWNFRDEIEEKIKTKFADRENGFIRMGFETR